MNYRYRQILKWADTQELLYIYTCSPDCAPKGLVIIIHMQYTLAKHIPLREGVIEIRNK